MVVYISGGSLVQTIYAPDVASLGYGSMDGFTKCGTRTYTLSPSFTWLTLVGDTLTLQSDVNSAVRETITLTVTLDSYPSITGSTTITAEIICKVNSI